MNAKIKDVAREANVSIATVSRVINNIPLVSEETRLRVLEVVDRLGYRPNEIARSLKLQKTKTIGVILYDITRLYFTLAARGVEDFSAQSDYNILLSNTDGDKKRVLKAVELFKQKQCDGIIYFDMRLEDEVREALKKANIPVVLGFIKDEKNDFPSVYYNDEEATYELIKYIIGMGHRDIGIINTDPKLTVISDIHKQGIDHAFKEAGIVFHPEWYTTADFTIEGGYKAMDLILNNETLPTVVSCASDEMAFGAMKRIEEEGLSIPQDISITGFNDFSLSRWSSPPLTSSHHGLYKLGFECAKNLIEELTTQDKAKDVVLPYEIIKRDSVKTLL